MSQNIYERSVDDSVFSEFLSDKILNIHQMEFVKLVVDYIIKNGSLDKRVLNEHSFNKRGNVMHLFDGKLDIRDISKLNDLLRVPLDYCNPTVEVRTEMVTCKDMHGKANHVLLIKYAGACKSS